MKPSVFYGGAPHGQNEDEDPDSSSTGDEWDPNISEDNCSDNSEENSSVDGHNSKTISDTECEEETTACTSGTLWYPITASQRSFPFTGNEQLLKNPTSTGKKNSVLPIDIYKLFVYINFIP